METVQRNLNSWCLYTIDIRHLKICSSDEIWHVSVDRRSTLAHHIWLSSVKESQYRSPPYVKICPKLWLLANGSRHWIQSDEIWHVSVYCGSATAVADQIWPSLVRGVGTRVPQVSKFAQNCGFWPPEADTMNTFRWNLACHHRPCGYCLMPNLAWITKASRASQS